MKREQMEELISAYVDNELSPSNRAKVESLVRSDLQAKKILQGYLLVRKAFENQIQVSRNVKAPPTLVPAFWSSVDAAQPVATVSPAADYSRSPTPWNISRLKNPRIYAYPLAVLVCALLIGLFSRNNDTQQAENPPSPNPGQIAIVTPDTPKEYAPMSSGSEWETQITQAPVESDKLIVVCQVESAAKMKTVFPKLFAAHSLTWSNTTTGKGENVYEINVSEKEFRSILNDFQKNKIELSGDTVKSLLEKAKKTSNPKKIRVLFSVETP